MRRRRTRNTRLPTARASASWCGQMGPSCGSTATVFGGKRKNMSFGTFPGVGLKAAREKRHYAEKLLDQGQDPVAAREAKRREDEKLKHTFQAVGEEWATTKLEKENKAKSTIKRERWNLAQLNREIGDRPLCEIAPPELLTAFRRVEARGRYYTVGRLRSTASRVFQFGVGASYCSSGRQSRRLLHRSERARRDKGNAAFLPRTFALKVVGLHDALRSSTAERAVCCILTQAAGVRDFPFPASRPAVRERTA